MLPDENGRLVKVLARSSVGAWRSCSFAAIGALIAERGRGHRGANRVKAVGWRIVAIMPVTQEFTEKFKADSRAPFPALTDLDNDDAP